MSNAFFTPSLLRRRRAGSYEDLPFVALQRQMGRLFEDFLPGVSWDISKSPNSSLSSFVPKLNVVEHDNEFMVEAELPGMLEKDIEVTLTPEGLLLKGEKRNETERKEGSQEHYFERSYGYFERFIPLGCEIDEDKIDASFKNGVLSVRVPKAKSAQKQNRKVSIKTS